MEFQKKRLGLVLASLLATTMVSGCDWWSDDDKKDEGLVCEAPAVPNEDETACINPDGTVPLQENQIAIYYKIPNAHAVDEAQYQAWGLHVWNGDNCPDGYAASQVEGVTWENMVPITGISETFGAYWVLNVNPDRTVQCANFIPHRFDPNEQTANLAFNLAQSSKHAFVFYGDNTIYYEPLENPPVALTGAAAHWISGNTLVWEAPGTAASAKLLHSADASIALEAGAITGNFEAIDLNVGTGLSNDLKAKFPHLSSMAGHGLTLTADQAKAALKHQLVVAAYDAEGKVLKATRVQIPGVIDDLYTSGENDADEAQLGAIISDSDVTFKLWAPTATAVKLHLFDADKAAMGDAVAMTLDAATGIWSHAGSTDLVGAFYKYEVSVYHPKTGKNETVMVTDPYSVSLSTNSVFSQVVDLSDPALKPAGWDTHEIPVHSHIALYEAHIRDFSAHDVSTPADKRGKYLAFAAEDTAPVNHLKALKEAGLTYLHLLPAFDIATINEDPTKRVDINEPVSKLCELNDAARICATVADKSQTIESVMAACDPTTDCAEQIAWDMREHDSFNWGYDPFHFGAPEGSYASNPDGTARIKEFREMVQAVHGMGLGVAMDVVYNHTNASGLSEKSVLDKVVPGYYHRLDISTGAVTNSTCCDNTATEHAMMAKLMQDTLVIWTEAYKIDSFRFDLMGHQPLAAMEDSLAATRAVNPNMYFYGEGWNFGEVANDARFVQARQENLAGTGIGSFSDRMRDAVRGGRFNTSDIRAAQGWASGLHTFPNERVTAGASTLADLNERTDQIKVELAGNLRNFILVDTAGKTKRGQDVNYGGSPSGYVDQPTETITYISKHDNQTFWDFNQYKIPTATPTEDRLRMHLLGLSFPMLSQGIPFLHMGVELLRSKSMERDSYNSGDWYNRVDFTGEDHNWNVGLPSRDKDVANWPTIGPILADAAAAPTSSDIAKATAVAQTMLKVRSSSKLFHLGDAQKVMDRVDFRNVGEDSQIHLIVMSIDDGTSAGDDLDENFDAVVSVFNGNPEAKSVTLGAGAWAIHPDLADSTDYMDLMEPTVDGATVTVPAFSFAVFVLPQGDAQGAGYPVDESNKDLSSIPPFGDTEVFLRGDMNGWGETNEMVFASSGKYGVTVTLEPGTYGFKVASSDWSTVDWGKGGETQPVIGEAYALGKDGNLSITLDVKSVVEFVADFSDKDAPTLLITAEELSGCELLANSADAGPITAPLAVRGAHSSWNWDAAYAFSYKGSNKYQVALSAVDLTGGFKLAGDTGNWDPQFVAMSSGSLATDLALNADYDVVARIGASAIGDPGNNTMALGDGNYVMTFEVTEDLVDAQVVGTLSVCEIE
ncbi:MAG: pullulanase-type alpha-1,6-glucosidase [Gammaproteobacteria bacterium]|nr:pullulanase-type alpha-1,6-glucosidase [Gammaproteobacteria bacterium]MBQ1785102.1 pullulanase-type alpha-1,6-glucosidase [Gammaproteobacteria bacterium]